MNVEVENADVSLSGMISIVVMFDQPAFADLSRLSRAERFRFLRSRSVELREQLICWIEEQCLSAKLQVISDPTLFNMLFVTCTSDLAKQIVRAPHVVRVFALDDLHVELLHHVS